MHAAPARSYLFVPGNRPERFARACSSGAHAVIVDLEDAVQPAEKDAARAALAAWVSPANPVIVRVNAADTPWHAADLELCKAPGVAGIVLPKAEFISNHLIDICESGDRHILPLIETAAGFDAVRQIAASPRVQRLLFGSIDFQVDLGIDGEGDELLYFRSQLVLVSRLAGIRAPVDGVSTAIDDAAALRADAERARRLGFGAKLCIHPKQVDVVNRAFLPGDAERDWARRVLDAAARAGGAAVAVDGKMVDKPVMLRAQAILDEAGDETPRSDR